MDIHSIDIEELVIQLKTHLKNGLKSNEISPRIAKYGENVLIKKKTKSALLIFLAQFINPIVALLFVAAIVGFAYQEYIEAISVLIVILINAVIGFIMEYQAKKSMLKLQEITKVKVKVVRDEQMLEVDSSQLVPGDLLFVEAGDMITADARIVEQHNLAVKESALTGESTQVYKEVCELPPETILAERKNVLFNGTVVTSGNGIALVVNTGMNTELGRISTMTQEAEKSITPLDKKLNQLSKKLIWVTLILTLLIVILGVFQGKDLALMIKTAIALAVAAIPEGLPIIATIALAKGMLRLSKKNVIVKTLEAVETLGETNAIYTDKTGTLTENEMRVNTLEMVDFKVGVDEFKDNKDIELLVRTGVLCNNARYDLNHKVGDPIEIALLHLAHDIAPDFVDKQLKANLKIDEVPFSSEIKLMGTLHLSSDKKYLISAKGATEEIIKCCTQVYEKGEINSFNDGKEWLSKVEKLASQGLRVLAFAYKEVNERPDYDLKTNPMGFIDDLVFLGIAGFIDPIRSDIKSSIKICKEAGIQVIMITGDHVQTAKNIATKIDLISGDDPNEVLHGSDITSQSIKNKNILNASVFARVSPTQKLELVSAYQEEGYIVGMTGDGVNDAPALKKADIGIAMGVRGTEVAKDAADIILKDDAFSSIILAIKQGRIIFDNIRKFVVYLLSCNISEILSVTIAASMNLPLPILPLQILFLNLVTDVFPALAIGMNEGEKNVMNMPPRNPKDPIIGTKHWNSIVVYGLAITFSIIAITWLGGEQNWSNKTVNNMAFSTLILAQLFNVFNIPKRDENIFVNEITKNIYIWGAILLCLIITVLAFAFEPTQQALSLEILKFEQLLIVVGFSVIPNVIIQFLKRVIKVIE